MKKAVLRLTILVFAICTAFQVQAENTNTTDLLNAVANRRSTASDFQAALAELNNIKTDNQFWLERATDELLEPNRRRKCVKYIFEHMDQQDLMLGKLLRSLRAPANWIIPDKIVMVPLVGTGPPSPIDKLYSSGAHRIIFIPILTEMRGDYRLGIYVGLGEDVDENELRRAFATGMVTDRIENVAIVGFVKYDTDDVESKWPGEAWRGITW